MGGAIPEGLFQFEDDATVVVDWQAFECDGGACDVSGDAFELAALLRGTGDCGIDREALMIDRQWLRGGGPGQRRGAQGQRALSCARACGDAIADRGGSEFVDDVLGFQVESGLFGVLSEPAVVKEAAKDAGDHRGEEVLHLCVAGCRHEVEANALADRFVDAVEYQHVQVHVEIGGTAVSLHEGTTPVRAAQLARRKPARCMRWVSMQRSGLNALDCVAHPGPWHARGHLAANEPG